MNSSKTTQKIKVVRYLSNTLYRFKIIHKHPLIIKDVKDYVYRLIMRGLLPEQQQTETTLLIDDERNIEADIVARSYEDGILALRFKGPFAKLYIDHDLASYYNGREKTGYDIVCWLEANIHFAPREIICVSANPVGKTRIEQVIQNIYRRRNNV